MYSLKELLGLFDLTYDIDLEGIKRAKKKVLMLHPDKSKLSSEYFLFYKRAFEIVVHFYEENNRQNKTVPTEPVKYSPMNTSERTSKQLNAVIQDMKKSEFHEKFNEIFEKNMAKSIDTTKNDWFKKEDPIYNIGENVSAQNMGRVFDTIKEKNSHIVLYQGVQTLNAGNSGTNLYDDEDDGNAYVTCDPFSKLKYDDLRKVHKDQTVLTVSEKDYQNMPRYASTDQYARVRGTQNLTPLEKNEAENMLSTQENLFKQRIMQKEYQSTLKTMEYEQKNKTVLSSFLQLRN
jgi:hypothetical protein